jgi:hypothetical protein
MQCHLHECVAIQELNEAMATLKAAAAGASQALGHRVLQGTILVSIDLLVEILKNDDDEPNDCQQKRSKSKTAEMITEQPFHSLGN